MDVWLGGLVGVRQTVETWPLKSAYCLLLGITFSVGLGDFFSGKFVECRLVGFCGVGPP